MRANNQRAFLPREGRTIADINRAWRALERAEHERELALKEELIRSVIFRHVTNTEGQRTPFIPPGKWLKN